MIIDKCCPWFSLLHLFCISCISELISAEMSVRWGWTLLTTVVLWWRYVAQFEMSHSKRFSVTDRDVTEPANIRIRRMRISCAKSVGFGCGCGFVVQSKLPATIVTVIQLSYLKLSSCKWTSSVNNWNNCDCFQKSKENTTDLIYCYSTLFLL